jgi:hypothetical protein
MTIYDNIGRIKECFELDKDDHNLLEEASMIYNIFTAYYPPPCGKLPLSPRRCHFYIKIPLPHKN